MTEDQRRSEHERREAALDVAGSGVEPGAREVPSARLKQMLSLRMEPELIRAIRAVAESRGISVSDLLREAAMDLVERHSQQSIQIHVEFGTGAETVIEPLYYASGTGLSGAAQAPTRGATGAEITRERLSA